MSSWPPQAGCPTPPAGLARDLRERGLVTKVSRRRDGSVRGGIPFTKGPLAYLLRNRAYVGEVIHKDRHYPGEHDPIIGRELFDAVQDELSAKACNRGSMRVNRGSLLTGRIFDDQGNRMTPASARKGGARYRYYVSSALSQGRKEKAGSVPQVPAPEIEAAVLKALLPDGPARARELDSSGDPSEADLMAGAVERIIVRAGAIEIVPKASCQRPRAATTSLRPCRCRGRRPPAPDEGR
jgi:site-specific DNA recombinase